MQAVALLLEQGKYYITETDDPAALLEEFRNDRRSNSWVRRYPIVGILEIKKDQSADELTLIYMSEKGLENVRGGSFSDININIDDLCRAIACKKCSSIDHRTENCDWIGINASQQSASASQQSASASQQSTPIETISWAMTSIGEFMWAAMNIGGKK